MQNENASGRHAKNRSDVGLGDVARTRIPAGAAGSQKEIRRRTRVDHALVIQIYDRECALRKHGAVTRTKAALHAMGVLCVYMTVRNIVAGVNSNKDEGRKTGSRFLVKKVDERGAKLPPMNSKAMTSLRTLYPSTVVPVTTASTVLKSGHNQAKIGAIVLKGAWAQMPVYTVTLEERATCPVSCRHLRSCYGNNMHMAMRFEHGPAFEQKLEAEIKAAGRRHPHGFVVRVHVLGDFYSVEYVRLWARLLDEVKALHVWGYTARCDDEIAEELRRVGHGRWPGRPVDGRWAMRFSNGVGTGPNTVSIELPVQRPTGAIVCPVQMNQTESCATCALCWSTRKTIAFLQH